MADQDRPNILVVDDVEANIDVLMETLSSEYEVAVAMDGETALEMCLDEPPDLVLLDIMMPEIDGYEVCERLKASPKTQDIPVIFVTAMGEVSDETKGFDLGAVDYITKPVSPPIVLARVRSTLNLKRKTEQLIDLSHKLSKYLDPQVYESIFRGEQDVRIESKRKKLSIFFSDIVSFTQTTSGMEAEDLTALLNWYLEEMASIAVEHGGTIDKYIGDAILVFFGDPQSRGVKEDAVACVSMALKMRDTVKNLQKKWYSFGIEEPFRVRAGISTGYCTVGNFGSRNRMDYTIIGSQVNIASRLESIADPDQIIISHETWSLVKDKIYCIKLRPVMVKGIHHPIQSYQVVDFIERMPEQKNAVTIGSFTEPAVDATSGTLLRDLAADFDSDNSQQTVVVTKEDSREPLGLVTAEHLSSIFETPEKRALHFEQPVTVIMDSDPLIVETEIPLGQVVRKVLARKQQRLYDPVIVTQDGVLNGVVPIHRILESLSIALWEETEVEEL